VVPVIPALRRLKQEDHEFKNSLGYIMRLKKEEEEEKSFCLIFLNWKQH
jgi:hypothetical protein